MPFPQLFLIELAKKKQLADRETQVFLALFGEGKTRLEIAEQLHLQESAISTCLSGVYRKFGISGSGPVKESHLKDELRRQEEVWQRQLSISSSDNSSTPLSSNETWIEQVREHCRQKILSQHSRIRLLSGVEIGVDQLYVDVWLLNRSPRTFQISESKLLETFDLRNDRLGLGDRIKRNSGFEVVNNNPKSVILGKPGSGKTTFLKHLAVDWYKGRFQPESIAVLIELRKIQDKQWRLIEAIGKESGLKEQYQIEALLEQGKFLMLMDGLDEVPTYELRHDVKNQLEQIANDYPRNRLILTCRTQIMGTIPTGFTSVEVAEFSEEQMQEFVYSWFIANGNSSTEALKEQKRFDRAIDNHLALKELTTTPVLLGLMCLVLHDEGNIPYRRDELYRKGIRLLLSKWNDIKEIDDWEIGTAMYRQLSVEQKEILLTELAASKFENPGNFVLFQQEEITTQITSFLKLADRKEGVAILRSIEAQHGLLIERADELWSFSHLTFQEYFTNQWLTQLSAEELVKKILSLQWQQAVKQIVQSQQPADRLIRLIKQAIDQSIANESRLQAFLTWVLQKSTSIQAKYKPAGIRAFYFDCSLDLILAHDRDLALAYALDLDFAHDIDLFRAIDFALARALALTLDLTFTLVHVLIRDLSLACDLDPKLADKLSQLILILRTASMEDFQGWWKANGDHWIHQLRQITIEHRNIGHDWQFTEIQTQQLKSYYELNKFLVELIKIQGAVSDTVRTEIEDTLLLPWEELQRRQR